MSKCQICGRPLSSPASIAAGVGPVCGGRSYTNRVKGRHTSFSGGWKDLNAWETVNHPCYSCKWFKVPPKDGEVSYVDKVSGQVCYLARMRKSDPWVKFPPLSIGGHCSELGQMVDGNQINTTTACGGEHYVMCLFAALNAGLRIGIMAIDQQPIPSVPPGVPHEQVCDRPDEDFHVTWSPSQGMRGTRG